LEQVPLSFGSFPKRNTVGKLRRVIFEQKLSRECRLINKNKLEAFGIKVCG